MKLIPDLEHREQVLNNFQQNLVVTAGAGTGKTSLLVGRLLCALVKQHLDPFQVQAVTFTDNAAKEMRARMFRMLSSFPAWLGDHNHPNVDTSDAFVFATLKMGQEDLSRTQDLLAQVEMLQIETFHGFCLRLLTEQTRQLDLPPILSLGESSDQDLESRLAFTLFLNDATKANIPQALQRFEASTLYDLAMVLLKLPAESVAGYKEKALPDDLAKRRQELQDCLETYPKALAGWKKGCLDLLAAYDAVMAGKDCHCPTIDKDKTPKAGDRPLGPEEASKATGILDKHIQFLKPFLKADEEGVQLALQFLQPFLQSYRQALEQRGDLSFDHLILLVRQRLMLDARFRQNLNKKLRCILVDEFQDTDPLQYDILFLLAMQPEAGQVQQPMAVKLRENCLCIVGDAKQSIYRFRSADIAAYSRATQNILQQDGAPLELSCNFRSQAPILQAVNKICQQSIPEAAPFQFAYQPVTPAKEGGSNEDVEVIYLPEDKKFSGDKNATAAMLRECNGNTVVQVIQGLLQQGKTYGDMAILLRAATDTDAWLRPLRKARIPYVLEGSRRFFQKHEVVLATALIQAIARPHDPVAVLAILRSAFSSASDAEILRHLQEGGSLDYRVEEASGSVAATLCFLRELHAVVSPLPVNQALTHILALDAWTIIEGSGFEGAQRLANIERLLQQVLELQFLDLGEVAEHLREQTSRESDDEESPLFDQGMDAVRLLTVHKAKGLEFDCVIIPDVGSKQQSGGKRGKAMIAQRLFDEEGEEIISLKFGDTSNMDFWRAKEINRKHEEAETQRLLYVAMTRAKERLTLICGPKTLNKRPWQDTLLALQEEDAIFSQSSGEAVPGIAKATSLPDPAPALQAFKNHCKLKAELWRHVTEADLTPSQLHEEPKDAEQTDDQDKAMADARDIGIAMHRYLALVDMQLESPDPELLRDLGAAEELLAMASSFHKSDLRQRLCRASSLHREISLSFITETDQSNAVVDLLIEEADGSYSILDWKTAAVAAKQAAQAASRYQGQLLSYSQGITKALNLPQEPKLYVYFLPNDCLVELEA